MIEAFQYINKAFESKVRLGIMAILMVNEEADFNFLKEQLSLTDGNLAFECFINILECFYHL